MASFAQVLHLLERYKPKAHGLSRAKSVSIALPDNKTASILVFKKVTNGGIGSVLQNELFEFLQEKLHNYKWDQEVKLLGRDRADIMGQLNMDSATEEPGQTDDINKIIVELDNSRADQIAKKYLSRSLAIMKPVDDSNTVLYVHVLYCTDAKISPSEAYKYLGYCKELTDNRWYYIGIIITRDYNQPNICVY